MMFQNTPTKNVETPYYINDGRNYISDLGEIKRQERRLAPEKAKAETEYDYSLG
jgi:hypothetical protein